MHLETTSTTRSGHGVARPRLGFIGVGHIGRDRLRLLMEEDQAEAAYLYDPDPKALEEAAGLAPDADRTDAVEDILDAGLDGVIISSPNVFHHEQATRALRAGIPVFCQKPIGRDANETAGVLDAARAADLPFGVDLPYRHARGLERAREAVQTQEIGELFGMDLTFHNGYGPQRPWFYDVARSGGGCLLDLGVHLVDLAFWLSESTSLDLLDVALWKDGRPLEQAADQAEDFALLSLGLDGIRARVACSWEASIGQDARFELVLHGTKGAVRVHNADGSFFRLKTEIQRKTKVLETMDEQTHWRGRALHAWTRDLTTGTPFDPRLLRLHDVVKTIHAARDACGGEGWRPPGQTLRAMNDRRHAAGPELPSDGDRSAGSVRT